MEHLAKMGYFEKEKRWSQEDFTIIKSDLNRLEQDNPFHANCLFLYPIKTSKNLRRD